MRIPSLLLSVALLSCGGTNTSDGGASDASGDGAIVPVSCVANRVVCTATQATTCDGNAQPIRQEVCSGATPTCVDGVGCRPCRAGSGRCDPSTGAPQVCRADNSGYDMMPACNVAQGLRCVEGRCLSACAEAAERRSYQGCEYWPVTLKNTCLAETGGTFPFAVAVANAQGEAVMVTVEGGALTTPLQRTVAANALEIIELPFVPSVAQLRDRNHRSVLARAGAYHLTSNAPVTVYQFNPLTFQMGMNYSYSNDASLLLPTTVLGTRYTTLTWPGMDFRIGNTQPWPSGGVVAVVGTSATPTRVNVALTGATFEGDGVPEGAAGGMQTFMLGRGDVLQILGGGMGTDLTGTTVQASAPVAVFNGHGCTNVPSDRLAGDHLEEQLFPDSAWGKRYAVTRFIDRPNSTSRVRIVALEATMVQFDPPSAHASAMLAARQVLEFDATADFVVSADKPMLVAQFMYGGGQESGEGDPAMVYEVPSEQYRTEYTFLAPTTYTHNYVNIVGPTGATPTLDGMPVTARPRAIGMSGMSVWAQEVMGGVHRLGAVNGATAYGLKVYGTAVFTSYAYPGGLDLRVLTPQ